MNYTILRESQKITVHDYLKNSKINKELIMNIYDEMIRDPDLINNEKEYVAVDIKMSEQNKKDMFNHE